MADRQDPTEAGGATPDFPYQSFKEYFLAQGHTLGEYEEHLRNRGKGAMTTYVYSVAGELIEIRRPPAEGRE